MRTFITLIFALYSLVAMVSVKHIITRQYPFARTDTLKGDMLTLGISVFFAVWASILLWIDQPR